MDQRPLGNTGQSITSLGFGAFKIGRNQKIKYPSAYDLPDDAQADRLLNTVLEMGVNYIDTAPAYGLSEQRIGRALAHRKHQFVLSTKVGETFDDGRSTYDFSASAVRDSIDRSLARLRLDALDLVFIHSDGRDLPILHDTDALPTLLDLRDQGKVRAVGFSGKTAEGAHAALLWADAVMVEYHVGDRSHETVIEHAARAGVAVIVKKGLASGTLPPSDAIAFVLDNPHVTSLVVGGLNLDHLQQNIRIAEQARPPGP